MGTDCNADASGRWMNGLLCAALTVTFALTACTHAPTNFSQYPGFAAYYAAHPRRGETASAQERALLQRFRPRFMLPPGHAGMIDFYRDYIAQGALYDADGGIISSSVTPSTLNEHKSEPSVVFVHQPDPARPAQATVYARVDRERVAFGANDTRDLVFLTYHAVFRHSGLPASVSGWRAGLLDLIADLDDWHQLDHEVLGRLDRADDRVHRPGLAVAMAPAQLRFEPARRKLLRRHRGDRVAHRLRVDEPVEQVGALHIAPRQAHRVLESRIGEDAFAALGDYRDQARQVVEGRVGPGR